MAPKDRLFSLVFFAQGSTTWDRSLQNFFKSFFFRKQRMPLLNAIFCFVGLIYYGLGESFQAVSLWYMMCHIQSSHPRKIMQKQHEFYYSKDPNKRVGLTVLKFLKFFINFSLLRAFRVNFFCKINRRACTIIWVLRVHTNGILRQVSPLSRRTSWIDHTQQI